MAKDQQSKKLSGQLHERTWLLLLVAVLMVMAGTMIWTSGVRAGGGGNDRDDKKEFQGRDDHDRDDRHGRNDDDWDDHDNNHHRDRYAIGLWGDLPYSDEQAEIGVPNLIMDMNSQDLAFTVHDGDLKAGSALAGSETPVKCTPEKYTQALGFLNSFKSPAAFTPGDNDWTDCDNAGVSTNGPYNSLERLDYERAHFFNTPFTQGQHHLRQAVQGVTPGVDQTPCLGFVHGVGTLDVQGNGLDTDVWKNVPCVENRRWTYRGVTYATLNIQGSCDNRCKDHPDPHEADVRQTAVIAWMRETFQVAKDRNSAAIMFITQADVSFNDHPIESEPQRDPKTLTFLPSPPAPVAPPVDGFKNFLLALRTEVVHFGKPVAYVHGDTHYFHVDKPFLDSKGQRLQNFLRIETFGDNVFTTVAISPDTGDLSNVHWVKVFVDPDSREVFAIQPQVVPANEKLVIHPLP
jgi:hypothetical protein